MSTESFLQQKLRSTEDSIDARQLEKIRQLQRNVLSGQPVSQKKEKPLPWLSAGLAASLLLFLTLTYQPTQTTQNAIAQQGFEQWLAYQEYPLEDVELLEDIEFYEWFSEAAVASR